MVAQVTPKGAARLRAGNPWVYRGDVVHAPEASGGAIVAVVDQQKNPIGQAFWAGKSPIALRLLTRRADERCDLAFFEERIARAIDRRAAVKRDAFRVVHGEADLLPGLFVDRYGDAAVLQTLSEGMHLRKRELAEVLARRLGVKRLVCRDDGSGRDFEGLPREKRLLLGEGSRGSFREGENTFELDLLEDMKTGSFLDQVENHLRAAELARGEALDCFSYHGGFALALATRCSSVLAVEQDEAAAGRTRANAERNGRANVQVECANAFDVLHGFSREGRQFDTVVIDPPGLAKRKEGVGTALRAYHELNLRALKCVRPDGLLVTCSCSGKVSREDFEQMVLGAAKDAKRVVQIVERRGAGIDHPGLGALPETEYLKVWILRVL
jgi:23S rRNA (cytosine1962-C5)-methyltransferase